ncbi:hypothetical protein [Flavobacterium sp. 3HN19-14]|uniref:hypothetical protein n=1 Tax=Flavobacterium sp. 3HN19-14 TaxID=3448133 RepID=UPI003EE0C2C2
MKNLFYILLLSVTALQPICAQTQKVVVSPKGEYAKIDVKPQFETIKALNDDDNNIRNKAMDAVAANPHGYNPAVLFAYSKILFDRDKKDDAMFWFYTAQLRARYDANLCLDETAKSAASELSNVYGTGNQQIRRRRSPKT